MAVCYVLDGEERGPGDLLRCPHDSLQRFPVQGPAAPRPDGDAAGQQALDGPSAKGG